MGFQIPEDNQKRNELCACESGLKFKKCHGDPAKLAVVKHVANEAMLIMIAYAKRNDLDIGFNRDDYEKVVDNPDFILPKFYEQFLS